MSTSRPLPLAFNTDTYGPGRDWVEGQMQLWGDIVRAINMVSANAGEELSMYKGDYDDNMILLGVNVSYYSDSYFPFMRPAPGEGHLDVNPGIPAFDGSMVSISATTQSPGGSQASVFQIHLPGTGIYDFPVTFNFSTSSDAYAFSFGSFSSFGTVIIKVSGIMVIDPVNSGSGASRGFVMDDYSKATNILVKGSQLGFINNSDIVSPVSENCSTIGCTLAGFWQNAAGGQTSFIVRNGLADGSGSEDYHTGGVMTLVNCGSSDGTGDLPNLTFTYTDAGGLDYSPAADSDAIGVGADLSGTFTDDIKGLTRDDWDIGAYKGFGVDITDVPGPYAPPYAQSPYDKGPYI